MAASDWDSNEKKERDPAGRAIWKAWSPLFARLAMYGFGLVALAAVGAGGLRSVLAQTPIAPPPAIGATTAASAAPIVEAHVEDAGAADSGADASKTSAINADGKVVLNLATEQDLRRLPGVGPTKAQAILALRDKLGKFKRPEDLLRIKGIGRRSLARLRPLVVVD